MYSNDAEHVAQTKQKRYIKELENELDKLEEENDKLSDDALLLQDKAADLNVQVKQLHSDNDELLGSNTQLSDQVSAYKSQLDAQKSVLAVASKSSEEARRLQKDSTKQFQLHRLEIENQRLRATVLEIEENEDTLVNEIDTLVREKSKFQIQEQSEELSSKCDALCMPISTKRFGQIPSCCRRRRRHKTTSKPSSVHTAKTCKLGNERMPPAVQESRDFWQNWSKRGQNR